MLLKDPDLRRQMGENGRAYVEKNYRWDVIIAKYEKMFPKLRAVATACTEYFSHGLHGSHGSGSATN